MLAAAILLLAASSANITTANTIDIEKTPGPKRSLLRARRLVAQGNDCRSDNESPLRLQR